MVGQTLRLYRNAYRGFSPSVWLLAVVMFINRSGTMVLPYLTLYLTQHLHYSVTDAGIIMAVYGTGALAGTYLGGRLTDRFGFYPIQFFSLLLAGIFLLVLQYVHSFAGICVSVFLFTLVGDAFRPANSAAIAWYSKPEDRTRAYSLNRLAINLGWSIGGGIGGYLASIDYSLLFWVDGLTCIVAALVLRVMLPVPAGKPVEAHESGAVAAPVRSPYQDRFFMAFLVFTTLFAMAFFQIFTMAPLYYKEVLQFSERTIGALMTMNGLMVAFVEMALIYALERRFGPRKMGLIACGSLLTGLAYLLLIAGLWPGWAFISMIVLTFSEMLAMPFMQSFAVSRSDVQNRGQYMALYSMAYAFAQITAPAIGSQLVALAGFTTLWLVLAGFAFLSAAGFVWLGQRSLTAVPNVEPSTI
ncbi:MFS transporter [Nibrella saemangeumensis]|uniref:MFS transporter n=1 Tax=Nibrella saemangeumensis TaxID=1084526 RepID=A0ABP8NB12_9BACT